MFGFKIMVQVLAITLSYPSTTTYSAREVSCWWYLLVVITWSRSTSIPIYLSQGTTNVWSFRVLEVQREFTCGLYPVAYLYWSIYSTNNTCPQHSEFISFTRGILCSSIYQQEATHRIRIRKTGLRSSLILLFILNKKRE